MTGTKFSILDFFIAYYIIPNNFIELTFNTGGYVMKQKI